MEYTSPFHIFKNKNIQSVDADSLKKLKKELLLEFDLRQKTTIELNGKEYDKATINSFFDELKKNGDFHLKVYKNKRLLWFLEKGDLRFFTHHDSWTDFEEANFKEWIAPFFIKKLRVQIAKCIKTPKGSSIKNLRVIKNSELAYMSEIKEQAYTEAFNYFEQLLKTEKNNFIQPFVGDSDSILKPTIKECFNTHHLNVLKVLPADISQSIIWKFGKAGRHLLSKAFYKSRKFREFKKDDLQALLNATDMYLLYSPDDERIKKLAEDTRSYLSNSDSLRKDGCSNIGVFIIAIFFMIRILILALGDDDSRHRSFTDYTPPPKYYLQNDPTDRDKSELIGEWSANIKFGNYKKQVKRTVTFFNEYEGRTEWQLLLDGEGKTCYINRSFNWDIKYRGPKNPKTTTNYNFYIQYQFNDAQPIKHNCWSNIKETDPFYEIEKDLRGKSNFGLDIYSLEKDSLSDSLFLKLNGNVYFQFNSN